MNENSFAKERGQSLVLVAAAMVVLVMFVAVAVDMSNAYYARRTAQNAADGAALAGVSVMATGINKHNPKLDDNVDTAMNDFAQRNGIEDTNDDPEDQENTNVEGWYVDGAGNRLPGEPVVGVQPGDDVPEDAYGVEAITHITATSFFGGIFGLDGYAIQARAVSVVRQACSADCVVPIVTDKENLFNNQDEALTGACYNIWSESELGEPGSYGWAAWTWQETACEDGSRPCPLEQGNDPCSTETLATNLDPENCASGFIAQGDWVANSTGIMNASNQVLCILDYYMGIPHDLGDCGWSSDVPIPFTIVVYDETNVGYFSNENPAACGGVVDPAELEDPSAWGLHYHVAGFAQMQILGYSLSQGGTNVSAQMDDLVYLANLGGIDVSDGFDPMVDCWNPPTAFQDGNRITAYFMNWVVDYSSSSECFDPWGTLLSSPRLIE